MRKVAPAHDKESMVARRGGAARDRGRTLHCVLLSNRLSVGRMIHEGSSLNGGVMCDKRAERDKHDM